MSGEPRYTLAMPDGRRDFVKALALAAAPDVPSARGRRYPFTQVDVFTDRPLEGNPLAVFTDARGLGDTEMQALARETNLSETTFIVPRDATEERKRGVQVRIWTPSGELPFAGHPSLGTATVIRKLRGGTAVQIDLDLKIGKIPVTFESHPTGLFAEMRQKDAEFGPAYKTDMIAPLIGLKREDIDPALPIQQISTGLHFIIVPLRSLQAIRSVRFNFPAISEAFPGEPSRPLFLVTRETEDRRARLHQRLVLDGGEDPATGSASGCVAAWMVRHSVARSGEQMLLEQGLEIHRSSRIYVRAERDGDRVLNVRVGGGVVQVMQGEYSL